MLVLINRDFKSPLFFYKEGEKMKGTKNPISIFKTWAWKRKQKKNNQYPYNRFRGFYGRTRKR